MSDDDLYVLLCPASAADEALAFAIAQALVARRAVFVEVVPCSNSTDEMTDSV
jgi:hypothetical protein